MVKVYSTPTCPWCKKAKSYLESKGIQYTEVNVAEDMEGRQEMISLSKQQGVPVLNIDGNIVIGFDKGEIDNYLSLTV